MSPQLFAILSRLVEERTGIHYDTGDREIFVSKATGRALTAGFESLLDYYYFLRYDAGSTAELDALIDALVVPETYFFREAHALRVAIETWIRPAVRRGRGARIWSAACSTGEEPLTLAMLLDESGLLPSVEIVASDLSTRALAVARAGGPYGDRSLRALPPNVLGRWLELDGSGAVHARPELLRAIAWRRINLCEPPAIANLGSFDLLVCRNVLIYFADENIARIAVSLSSALRPEGRLLLGASESLMRFGTLLECEEQQGAFFYRSRKT
ncbi:CheR family methyltransferase [Pendulispora albinea]|uniref:protein-glutamate O-methyltransferase n=1 Tax=Pendulispora albinea TaxID=2741071 RepID=A0ABZ2M7J3_9BACT